MGFQASFGRKAITAPNIFLVLILLLSFITPIGCADSKSKIDNTRIKIPIGASEDDIKKALSQSWGKEGSGSQRVMEIKNEHATEYTAQMQGNWKIGSGSGRAQINNEHVVEGTAMKMHSSSVTSGGSMHVVKKTSKSVNGEITEQETFEYWASHDGSGIMDEIARKLGRGKKGIDVETAKGAATFLKPPPPPSGTIKGYIQWLDESRPTTIEEYLRNFEVMFVIDDSGSMEGERWTETRDALATVAQKAFELKVDTVGLRFLNDASHVRGLKGKKKLMSLFEKVKPNGKTPLGKTLNVAFNEHLNRVDSAIRDGPEKYSKILPLDIVVLTDGMPTDKGEYKPADVFSRTVKRLKDNHYHPNTMNIQIVQIANEEKAKKMFRNLVVGDNGGIVDTVPYEGPMNPEKILKILLKGVHPNIRAQLPEDMLAI